MSNEEKIDQAKSAVKEAFGKVTGDKKVELIQALYDNYQQQAK